MVQTWALTRQILTLEGLLRKACHTPSLSFSLSFISFSFTSSYWSYSNSIGILLFKTILKCCSYPKKCKKWESFGLLQLPKKNAKKGKALECYNFQKTMQRKGRFWNVATTKKKWREREKELLVNDGGWSFQQWTHSGIVKCT